MLECTWWKKMGNWKPGNHACWMKMAFFLLLYNFPEKIILDHRYSIEIYFAPSIYGLWNVEDGLTIIPRFNFSFSHLRVILSAPFFSTPSICIRYIFNRWYQVYREPKMPSKYCPFHLLAFKFTFTLGINMDRWSGCGRFLWTVDLVEGGPLNFNFTP